MIEQPSVLFCIPLSAWCGRAHQQAHIPMTVATASVPAARATVKTGPADSVGSVGLFGALWDSVGFVGLCGALWASVGLCGAL